jgi:oligopeptide/dipeptide ABC transporter ATP-binding protein
MIQKPLLDVASVVKTFFHRKEKKQAIDNVSLVVYPGEVLAIAGESGSGKSTLAKLMVGLETPTRGSVLFEGHSLESYDRKERAHLFQMIFQDAYSALNPKMAIADILQEPFKIHNNKITREDLISLLQKVGLKEEFLAKLPHECSGGQRQRIVIARALALKPKLLVCDEPVSSLDVSLQLQILHLFSQLQKEEHLTYVFIGHDLSVLRQISSRIAIFYLGNMVELAETEDFYNTPLHPYSQLLLSSVPSLDPEKERKKRVDISFHVSKENSTSGCPFASRCRYRKEICCKQTPLWQEKKKNHFVSCHLYM